jgi:hypothetical protein
VNAFFSKIGEFQKPPRNPLWKSVNLATTIPGWTRFPAAEEWIENWRKGNQSSEHTDQFFREFQSSKSKQN